MKKALIGGISVVLILFVSAIGLFFGCSAGWNGTVEKANEKFVATEACTSLKIDAAAGQVTVKTGETEFVAVDYYNGGKIKTTVTQTGGAIVVTQIILSPSVTNGGEITVLLPQTCEAALDVSLDAGEVVLEGLVTPRLTLSVDAGEATLKNCSAPLLDAEVDAGELSVENGTFNAMTADVDTGNLSLKKLTVGQATLTVNVGNIEAEVLGKKSDYTLSGRVDVGNKNFAPQTGATDKSISAEVDVGNITLTFREG